MAELVCSGSEAVVESAMVALLPFFFQPFRGRRHATRARSARHATVPDHHRLHPQVPPSHTSLQGPANASTRSQRSPPPLSPPAQQDGSQRVVPVVGRHGGPHHRALVSGLSYPAPPPEAAARGPFFPGVSGSPLAAGQAKVRRTTLTNRCPVPVRSCPVGHAPRRALCAGPSTW